MFFPQNDFIEVKCHAPNISICAFYRLMDKYYMGEVIRMLHLLSSVHHLKSKLFLSGKIFHNFQLGTLTAWKLYVLRMFS